MQSPVPSPPRTPTEPKSKQLELSTSERSLPQTSLNNSPQFPVSRVSPPDSAGLPALQSLILSKTTSIPPTSPPIMRPTLSLLQMASSPHKPLIKFLGKRTYPKAPDSTPHVHPASPTPSLPDSFASYRSKAQQHGPLAGHARTSTAPPMNDVPRVGIAYGDIGGHTGHELGKVEAGKGLFFDRSELPERFRRMSWTEGEIEAVGSGGASVW